MAKYLIVIPTYNRVNSLIECLNSIQNAISLCSESFHINVVVNDSPEYQHSILKNRNRFKKYQHINFIKGDPTFFWTKSIYIGINSIIGQLEFTGVFLINDDSIVEEMIFSRFLDSNLDEVKYCRVNSTVQVNEFDLQAFEIKPRYFSISPLTNTAELYRANAIACRFSYFPVKALEEVSWSFIYFLPHYLGDLYLSYALHVSGIKSSFINGVVAISLDRIKDGPIKKKKFFFNRFSATSPNQFKSLCFFWILIMILNLRKIFLNIAPKV